MRQFNFFKNGGPYPGTCLSCGNNKELYDLGKDQQTGSSHLLCTNCVAEVAAIAGYTPREAALKTFDALTAQVAKLEKQAQAVPNLIEGLIDGVRSSVADFVLAVSSSDDGDSSSPVQDVPKATRKPSGVRETANIDN
jgi:hypothetical protein